MEGGGRGQSPRLSLKKSYYMLQTLYITFVAWMLPVRLNKAQGYNPLERWPLGSQVSLPG